MQALVKIMEAEKLFPIFDIPVAMRNRRLEVTIRPADEEKQTAATTIDKIRKFREKHTHEAFVEHLKKKLAEGVKFDFDAQKIIDGTETEEDIQERYKIMKGAWAEAAVEKFKRNE
ncbi:MAG: hypothetical protein LBG72_04950 [Spirochaetaceae bacterium]|jgi:hypothetical protein|nr:hypothetical protein [Spirochaetaceae bacterium]